MLDKIPQIPGWLVTVLFVCPSIARCRIIFCRAGLSRRLLQAVDELLFVSLAATGCGTSPREIIDSINGQGQFRIWGSAYDVH